MTPETLGDKCLRLAADLERYLQSDGTELTVREIEDLRRTLTAAGLSLQLMMAAEQGRRIALRLGWTSHLAATPDGG